PGIPGIPGRRHPPGPRARRGPRQRPGDPFRPVEVQGVRARPVLGAPRGSGRPLPGRRAVGHLQDQQPLHRPPAGPHGLHRCPSPRPERRNRGGGAAAGPVHLQGLHGERVPDPGTAPEARRGHRRRGPDRRLPRLQGRRLAHRELSERRAVRAPHRGPAACRDGPPRPPGPRPRPVVRPAGPARQRRADPRGDARDRYSADLRRRLQRLFIERFGGTSADYHLSLEKEDLARLHFTVWVPEGQVPDVAFEELDAEVMALTRSWAERVADVLSERMPKKRARDMAERWESRLPDYYKTSTQVTVAAGDDENLERLATSDARCVVGLQNE